MSIQISDEERQRRRDKAKELVAAGRIGGPRPGSGRPRKKRASEVIAEKVERRANEVSGALFDGLKPHQPQTVRNDSARTLLAIEEKEHLLRREEERELRAASRDELVEGVFELFDRLAGPLGLVPRGARGDAQGVIEGRASRALPPAEGS
jgi:hypothetical protein